MSQDTQRPVLRAVHVAPALLAVALVAGAGLAGCTRKAPTPDPVPRYRDLGPKADIPDYLADTVLAQVDVHSITPQVVSGYGVVVNLENTGRDDGIPAAIREHVVRTAVGRGVGSELTEGALGDMTATYFLADPRNAVVRVDGIVPPGARRGQRIDVRVAALDTNTTTSLARGQLYRTELHTGIVTPQSPGERVNLAGQARGRLSVNPVYALQDPLQVRSDPSAQASLRTAYIQDGGIFDRDRPIILRLRQPSWRTSRAIEKRINLHFGRPVAAAQDEAVVYLAVPEEFGEDWEHFLGVATTLYYSINKEFAAQQAERLVKAAQAPGIDEESLEGISYAWEGLGSVAVPKLVPFFTDPNPAVAYWAARAAAFNGEPSAVNTLVRIAAEPQNPYAVRAAQTLGALKPNSSLIRDVRRLLDVDAPDVRIAAYQSLLRLGDQTVVGSGSTRAGAIVTNAIGDKTLGKQFYLDQVPSKAPPLIWASRTGTPRIAIIGSRPEIKAPSFVTAFGDRLTIRATDPNQPAKLVHRPLVDRNSSIDIVPDVVELIATLGGETRPGNVPIRLAYGDVIAVIKQMADDGQIVSGGRAAKMILEDLATGLVDEAPSIPGLEELQASDGEPADPAGTAPQPGAGTDETGSGRVSTTRD